jgi:hypothetical protein
MCTYAWDGKCSECSVQQWSVRGDHNSSLVVSIVLVREDDDHGAKDGDDGDDDGDHDDDDDNDDDYGDDVREDGSDDLDDSVGDEIAEENNASHDVGEL